MASPKKRKGTSKRLRKMWRKRYRKRFDAALARTLGAGLGLMLLTGVHSPGVSVVLGHLLASVLS
jgi:hypothetical protein